MCFKKPKPPEKTPEDIKAEKELEEMRKIRAAQLANELKDSKENRTEDAIARAMGFMGNRSLIKGGKGGAGFLGAYSRTPSGLIPRSGRGGGGGGGGGGGTRPIGIPIAGGGSGGSGGASRSVGGGGASLLPY